MLKKRRVRERARGERGSLAVTVMIIMIVVALGSVLLTDAVSNDKSVLDTQSSSSALASAEAGVSDALFRIDQKPSSSFCVGPNSACVAASIPGAPGVEYQATAVSSTKWLVRSKGVMSNGVSSAVQVSVTRSVKYPFALFGNTGLVFNGQSSNGFGTYDPTQSPSGSNPDTSGAVSIGSNGTISCNGGLVGNVSAVYYSGGGGISGSCGTPVENSNKFPVSVPAPPPGSWTCPNGGMLGSAATASSSMPDPGVLPGGTYVCNVPVSISGNLSVEGPVSFYIELPPSANTSTTVALGVAPSSTVNYSSGSLPDATELQIFSNSIGLVGGSHGLGYTMGAILDAPNASLTADGCKSVYYGSLLVNTLTCNGGPHLTVYYDSALDHIYTKWSTSGYQQIPSALVTLS